MLMAGSLCTGRLYPEMNGLMQLRPLYLSPAILVILLATSAGRADDARIEINADRVIHTISSHLTGACIEDVNHEVYGGIYSQMIFGESFQEPAQSPDIKGFKTYGGWWVVREGTLRIDGGDGPKLVSDHAAFKDGAAGVEVFFADRSGQSAGLVVRLDNPGVGADKFTGYEVALDVQKQKLSLARHRNNYEPIDDVHCAVATGRWVPLEVRLAGSVIEILVDGKSMLRHEDAEHALAAGTVALRPWHREVSYRNLWVKPGERVEPLLFDQTDLPRETSGLWRPVVQGDAVGSYAIVKEKPFTGTQSQQVVFESGAGEIGIENQGLNRWGISLIAGKTYEGYVWVRAAKPTTLFASAENRDGTKVYAEQPLNCVGNDWQRLDFTLTPSETDEVGRFALKLKQPGSVTIGHAFLQAGEWGRFQGLPVRRDVAEGLINQGVSFLRYGGSMVNDPDYNWKNMVGPRDRRPPYRGTWYAYSSNGWGIPDFMAFCEAAGFEYVPAFNMVQTPQDMADFVDYAEAPTDIQSGRWGAQRAKDGHPAPFRVRYLELGNEERVDDKYADKFEALAGAIWGKDPKMILVVGDFAYNHAIRDPFAFTGAASGITTLAAHERILRFTKQHNGEVWFDVHVWTDHPEATNSSLNGMFSFTDALAKIADGARHKVVVFELNSGNHAQKRALASALAINAIERDGRTPFVSAANCLQPDKQNDNGWDQGLLFLNPARVWLQPPGYLTQMLSGNYLPQLVQCEVTATGTKLDANAKRSEDGKTLVLQVVNPGDREVAAQIRLSGFTPTNPTAKSMELAGPLDAANTVDMPDMVVPRQGQWQHELKGGRASYRFPAHSVTVLRFE
jgi:alpha-L-arabinofuranosidase